MSGCTLIGILDDGWDGLSGAARRHLREASVVIGAERTLALVRDEIPSAHLRAMDGALADVPGWIAAACSGNRAVAVLATGDPFCHGIGKFLSEKLRDRPDCALEILPGVSVLQLACARFRQPWSEVGIASCHARDTGEWYFGATPEHALYPAVRALARHPLVFVFTGPENTPARLARALLAAGYECDEITFSVASRLLQADERLFPAMTLADAARTDFSQPNVVLVRRESGHAVPVFGLDDSRYVQRAPEKGLITKQEARVLSLAKMRIAPDAVVWDIGAGAGSVGLEAAGLAPAGHVWAIEKNPADAANARENARRLRITNYTLEEDRAPRRLDAWPDPDAVFIGGSGGELAGLIPFVLARMKPGGRLVMNFVTLENLAAATTALDRVGAAWEVTQLQASRSQPIVDGHRLAAQNPVWIMAAGNGGQETEKTRAIAL
ncbi:MAG: precorrin-6y C5,15-methyltransferase (decarboxylating) subunit CbiE [Candidatus Accumulibacter sp.]|jgi:precorrin-6Y C5,15-methyltransferase (decarboxylating)|nr:precorrin-6y C5,15-methyltransferase (decarboxylating) subunit CbiE [Accumulibacter sp.]